MRPRNGEAARRVSGPVRQPYNAIISDARRAGAKSLVDIAANLTERGVPTPSGTGHVWHARQVSRLIEQAAA